MRFLGRSHYVKCEALEQARRKVPARAIKKCKDANIKSSRPLTTGHRLNLFLKINLRGKL